MKVLVTGATGFIGSHLVEALINENREVKVLVRSPELSGWLKNVNPISLVNGALENSDSLKKAVEDVDLIYHCAGAVKAVKGSHFFEVNAKGTENLLEAAAMHGKLKRFVFVSSQAAAGPSSLNTPTTEEDEPDPITPYGKSKLLAEKAVLDYADRYEVVIVRPPAVYGPRERDIFTYFKLASSGFLPKPGYGQKMVSLVYSSDLVQGLLLAGNKPEAAYKTYFITSGDHEWLEIGKAMTKAVGRGRVFPIPMTILYIAALLSQTVAKILRKPAALDLNKAKELGQKAWLCSSDKAKNELGYKPEWSLEKGMEATTAWYRKEGWIR